MPKKLRLNNYINKLIRSKKMKQYEVAERAGLNLYHLRNMIAPGATSAPYLGTLIKIIQAMDCTDEEIATIVKIAKKMRPNEPYEVIMPNKTGTMKTWLCRDEWRVSFKRGIVYRLFYKKPSKRDCRIGGIWIFYNQSFTAKEIEPSGIKLKPGAGPVPVDITIKRRGK